MQSFSRFQIKKKFEVLTDYGKLYHSSTPYYEVYPSSIRELSAIMEIAYADGIPMRFRGYGHSLNGSSLPRKNELLIRSDQLNGYLFEKENTVTVEGGVKIWNLQQFLEAMHFELPVYNGGGSAPSLGGFISAGGIGNQALAQKDAAFWNFVEYLELFTPCGKIIKCTPQDELFPWFFGSMGQLGFIAKARLKIYPSRHGAPYPMGLRGKIRADGPTPPNLIWFTIFCSEGKLQKAQLDLKELTSAHPHIHWSHLTYRFECGKIINPPLLYPFQETFVGCEILGTIPRGADLDLKARSRLESDFEKVATSEPGFRRYIQTELVHKNFSYENYFGEKIYSQFYEIKKELDDKMLINQDLVFPRTPITR